MNPGFSPDERCLIGVSGGRDSVVLLHQLHAAGFRQLVVCHLDHALRAESAGEARFVADLAARYGFESVLAREEVAARAKEQKLSLEAAAREARYEFFARAARERDCPRLFLAHQADDQVETFLFNLFRGAAAGGLAGMRPLTMRVIDGVSLRISRPLLGVWRDEIDAYVAEHRLAYCEDPSNTDLRYSRNRLRHEVIPMIEKVLGRDIRRAVWRTAEILREEDAVLRNLPGVPEVSSELRVSDLRAQPVALQRRLLNAWLKIHGVPDAGFEEVEAVRGLLAGRGAKVNLPGGRHARRRAGKLFLEPLRTSGLSG